MVSASTRAVCLLGHPVAHSVSPQIHNAGFTAARVDAIYLAFDVPPEQLAAAIDGLRALRLLGANVTVPHKRAALQLADACTPEADMVGAANTLWWDAGALVADNTDARGLQEVLEWDVQLQPGDPVLLFGSGGAARAAAVALGRLGAQLQVRARRVEAAQQIAKLACSSGARMAEAAVPRVVVNATPLGLHGEALPDPLMTLGPGQVALDLVYGPADTPFLAAARARGATALDGLGMLVAQAGLAWTRWTGQPAPITAMRAAAEAALGR
jgi:shikimate dehydrogenase